MEHSFISGRIYRGNARKLASVAAAAVLLSSTLGGCVTAAVSGATAVSYAVVQERSVGNAVDDATILTHINSLYLQKHVDEYFSSIDVDVHEGRVLLTGKVPTAEHKVEAVRLAWQPVGVREVINEIIVADKSTVNDYARDAWINAQINGKLLVSRYVRSINYSVEVLDGVVYLFGIAQDKDELDRATQASSTVKGVQKVISHVRLKTDPARQG